MRGKANPSSTRVGQLKFASDSPIIACINQNAQLCTSLAPGQQKLTDLFSVPSTAKGPLHMTTTPKNSSSLRSSLLLSLDDEKSGTPETPASSAKTPMMTTFSTRCNDDFDSDDAFESPETELNGSSQNDVVHGSGRKARSKLQLRRRDQGSNLSRSSNIDSDSGVGSQSPSGKRIVGVRIEQTDGRLLNDLNCSSPACQRNSFSRSRATAQDLSPTRTVTRNDGDDLWPNSYQQQSRATSAEPGSPKSPILGQSDFLSTSLQPTLSFEKNSCMKKEELPRCPTAGVEERPSAEASAPRRRVRQLDASDDDGDRGIPPPPAAAAVGRRTAPMAARLTAGRTARPRPFAEDIDESDDETGSTSTSLSAKKQPTGSTSTVLRDKKPANSTDGRPSCGGQGDVEIDLAGSSEDERAQVLARSFHSFGTRL
jgi:hypothetical protein